MAGSIEFTPPYQDGWQDNEEGATPITADILNNNYDAFLLLLNTWIGNIEEELVAVPDFQISSPSSGQVLKYDGSKWVNAAESGGGSNVSWNQVLQSGTQIASITINGTSYTVYAPTPITNLNGLSDVTLANLANGQVLQYNSSTSKWENKSISVGDSVEFTQILSSGVKIGTITIDGTDYDIYAPQGGGGSYEPNGVTYTIINNDTDDTQSGQTARSIVVNKFEDNVQTDTGSLSYATVVTTGPNNFTVGNVKTTYTLVSGTAYWVLTVVSGHIQYNGTLYETGDEILRTPVSGSSVITLTDIEEMEESHSTVVWTQTQQSGTKIAEISIDGVSQNVYIPNLPTKTSDLTNDSNFVADASYVHTDNNYTTPEKNKLADLNQVEANPSSGTSAGNLNSIEIGGTKYDIPSGGSGGSDIEWTQIVQSGIKIAEIEIDGSTTNVYAPNGGGGGYTEVTGTLTAGQTEITLYDNSITVNSTFEAFTDPIEVSHTDMMLVNEPSLINDILSSADDTKVTASSIDTAAVPPWKAFDGIKGVSSGTYTSPYYSWLAGNGDAPCWLQYHFATAKYIDAVKVYVYCNNGTYTGSAKIQGSNDGTTWTDISSAVSITAPYGEEIELDFTCDGNTYSYVRLYSESALAVHGGASIFVGEMEIYGRNSANGVKVIFPVQSENLNVKVRVS